MAAARLNRHIRIWTIFKLLLLITAIGAAVFLLWQGAGFTPRFTTPSITPPPQGTVGRLVELSGSGSPSSVVEIAVNGKTIGRTLVGSTGRWAYTLPAFTEAGEYQVTAAAVDRQGNTVSTAISTPILLHIAPTPSSISAIIQPTATSIAAFTPTSTPTASPSPTMTPQPTATTAATPLPTPTATSHPTAEPTMPPAPLLTALTTAKQLATFLDLLNTAALTNTLTNSTTVAILAPTDDAFATLPPEALDALLNDEDALATLLNYHLVTSEIVTDSQAISVTTAADTSIPITATADSLTIGRAAVISTTVTPSGTIYLIDQLLIPTAANIETPIIDESGIPTYEGPFLTVVGTAEPQTRLVVMINDSWYGESGVSAAGTWLVSGVISPPGEFYIVAYTLSEEGLPLAVSKVVLLEVSD